MSKEKKYFKLTCVDEDRARKITKDDINLLLNTAAAIYKYGETIVMDDYLVFGTVNKDGYIDKENPYCSHFMDAFSIDTDTEERIGYLGDRARVAATKNLFVVSDEVTEQIKNIPVFFKIKSKYDTSRDVNCCIYVAYNDGGNRSKLGVIDHCDDDEGVWANVYAVNGSDHIIHYCNIDSSDKDAPISYKNILIDTMNKSNNPISFKSSSPTRLSIDDEGYIETDDMIDYRGISCRLTINTESWKQEWIEKKEIESAASRLGMSVEEFINYRKEKGVRL